MWREEKRELGQRWVVQQNVLKEMAAGVDVRRGQLRYEDGW
jgi:hypothetical protein